jgi:hypothetical protein
MKREAVEAARIEFNRASNSVNSLSDATDHDEIETHWVAFLSAATRIFNKLQAGAKKPPQSKQWFDSKVRQRQDDQLLSYIWHARNANDHGLEFVTRKQPGFIREVPPTPEEREAFERGKGDHPALTGHVVLEITEPHVRLLDVLDHGNRHSPPPNCIKPYNTGMLALSKLEPILLEAEALVAKP